MSSLDSFHRKHWSAIDIWLAVILCGAPTAIAASGIHVCLVSVGAGVVLILTGCLIGLMIASLSVPCFYELSETGLRVRCGMMDELIPWSRVKRLELYSGLWSAPALSLRRVKVTLDSGELVVSPRDRAAFIRDCQTCLGAYAATQQETSRSRWVQHQVP